MKGPQSLFLSLVIKSVKEKFCEIDPRFLLIPCTIDDELREVTFTSGPYFFLSSFQMKKWYDYKH